MAIISAGSRNNSYEGPPPTSDYSNSQSSSQQGLDNYLQSFMQELSRLVGNNSSANNSRQSSTPSFVGQQMSSSIVAAPGGRRHGWDKTAWNIDYSPTGKVSSISRKPIRGYI